jgi:integrase/recombinase XerD
MKLSRAIETYVQRKQAAGLTYAQTSAILRIFARKIGDVPLTSIGKSQISVFLSGRPTSTNNTWLHKYRMLKNFFEYWRLRGQLKTPRMPLPRLPCPRTFLPYIYTRFELKRMLSSTTLSQRMRRTSAIDSFTFRTLLLFLYGTGVHLSEALTLQRSNLDLREDVMTIHRENMKKSRHIPIGRDVHRLLVLYLKSPVRKLHDNANLFLNIRGSAIGYMAVYKGFRRLCRYARIVRHEGGRYQPRIIDLRFTFAVHRLSTWFQRGINVELMLPALSEYLGEINMGSMEKYLGLTPERFRRRLINLSPQKAHIR